jgi:hypothetical protein
MSPSANIDNRIFSPNLGVRYAFTESELQAMGTISEVWNGTIGSDVFSISFYRVQPNRTFVYICDSLHSGDFTELQGILILIREEILNHAFTTYSGILKLEYDPQVALDNQNFSRIYDCGSLYAYK